jgi:hypothetical protein
MATENELKRYAAAGMAAYLPGMVYALELLEHYIEEFREQLTQLQVADQVSRDQPPPQKQGKRDGRGKSSWQGMTPEERSVEMKRRMKVRRRNKTRQQIEGLHPRDKGHPDHAKWLENLSKRARARWDKKSKAEKAAWKTRMQAGKAKQLALAS